MLVSIIVPCYNEEAALPYFLKEIKKSFLHTSSQSVYIPGNKFHILLSPYIISIFISIC